MSSINLALFIAAGMMAILAVVLLLDRYERAKEA
jgi:uncharacterized membrane protein